MEKKTVQIELLSPEDLSEDLHRDLFFSSGLPCIRGDKVFFLSGDKVVKCDNTPDVVDFVYSVIYPEASRLREADSESGLYFRLLTGTLGIKDRNLLEHYHIPLNKPRCVIIFRTSMFLKEPFGRFFSDMASIEEGDHPVSMDYHSVALIKNAEKSTEEEILEYALAVTGSMESEGMTGIKAGIGGTYASPEALHISYIEAEQSVRTGMRFSAKESVFMYRKQMLERIIDSIPKEKKKEIRNSFFQNQPGGCLSGELMETVQVFFQNDLNLTAASRQLFIHRNTLNYRLDKIKKIYGLDLRSFSDAAVFKVLLDIPDEQ